MLLSKGKKFTLVHETQGHHKFLNDSNCEIAKVSPRKEGFTKLQMKTVEGSVLYHIDFRPSESSITLCSAKRDVSSSEKKIIASLKTKVENGNRFTLSVKEEKKYGPEKQIEFSSDCEFSVKNTQDDRPFCIFQSNGGSVGISGGKFRISGGQRRNFTLGIISLVYLMQEEAHKCAKTKGTGFFVEDLSQKTNTLPSRSQKSQPNLPMLVFPNNREEDSGTRPKTARAEITAPNSERSIRRDTEEEPFMLSPQGKPPRRSITHSGGSPKRVSIVRNPKKLSPTTTKNSINDLSSESENEKDYRQKKQLPKRLINSGATQETTSDSTGEPHHLVQNTSGPSSSILSTTSPRSLGNTSRRITASIPTTGSTGVLSTSPRNRTVSALTPTISPSPARGRTSSDVPSSNISPRENSDITKKSSTSPLLPYQPATPRSTIPSPGTSSPLGSINSQSNITTTPGSSSSLGSINSQPNITTTPGSSSSLGSINSQSNITTTPGSSSPLGSINSQSNITTTLGSSSFVSSNNQQSTTSPRSSFSPKTSPRDSGSSHLSIPNTPPKIAIADPLGKRSPANVIPGKGLNVDSYVKCWEQLEAIAGFDKFT